MAWKNIAYCVHSVMHELDESTTASYHKYCQFGYRAWRELNLGVIPTVKVTYLTIENNLTVELPSDYISYTAIGVCVGGRIYTLTLNNNLCLNREVDDCCDPITEDTVPTNVNNAGGGYWFMPSWRNGKYVGESYGIGGGWNWAGYYRFDYEKNRIQFANLNSGLQIILEYKASGVGDNGEVCLPEEAIESVIAYIHWKRVQNNPSISLGEKNRAREDYFIQYQKTQMFLNSFTADEYLDDRLADAKSSPRR